MTGPWRMRLSWAAPVIIGALLGSGGGAEGQQDPLCPHLGGCLFEAPGFTIRVVDEQTGQPDSARVHAFHLGGRRVELTQFQGTPAEVVAELRKAAHPSEVGIPSVNQPASIREVYVKRFRRVRADAERLPRVLPDVNRLLDRLDDDIHAFSAGGGR